jgi:hypothetical protein
MLVPGSLLELVESKDPGSNSVFSTITSTGGGGGGAQSPPTGWFTWY